MDSYGRKWSTCTDCRFRSRSCQKVEDIYSQVGVSFDLAERIVVTNMLNTAKIARGGEVPNMISFTNLVSAAHGTGGLELYFIESFYNVTNNDATLSKVVGVNRPEGLAVAKSATATTLAHEIGHAFGLDDIYVMKQSLSVGGLKTRCSFGRLDWNDGCDGSGDGGARYYPFGTLHKDIIGCLLMNGDCGDETLGGSDLTYGRIYGVVKKSSGNAYADAEVGWFVSASEGVVEHE